METEVKEVIRVHVEFLGSNNNFNTSKNIALGDVVGISVYVTPSKNGTELKNHLSLSIKDQSSEEVVKIQPVEHLRNREASYPDSYVPVNFRGGQVIDLDLFVSSFFSDADEVFVDVLLIYKKPLKNASC